MVEHPEASQSAETLSSREWIDDIADRYEAAWQELKPPCPADFLGNAAGELRNALLDELSKIDAAYRERLTGLDEPPRRPDEVAAPGAATPLPVKALLVGTVPGGPAVPGFAILGELGHGGMGVVYKARHLRLKRLVALKMISAATYADPRAVARFRTEMEAVARLQHPNIVQIHEVGEQDGRPFCALEHVDGGSLAQRLEGTPQPPHQAAELVETLARAVHYAHQQGIIHRDLKPANILLQSAFTAEDAEERRGIAGSPPRSSASSAVKALTPKITDFGLAKQLDAELPAYQTQTGEIIGTPSYMAPEQAEGKLGVIGPATDIYALGAILYELLTGRPPFKGETTLDTLEQVRTQEPVSPRRLQHKVPRDLSTICLKAMAKSPSRRYATASDLADDLRRWLDGRPIQARPVSQAEKLWRWCRRYPAEAGLMMTVVFLLVGLAVVTSWAAIAAGGREKETKRALLLEQLQFLRLGSHKDGWTEEARKLIREAAEIRRDDQLRGHSAATFSGIEARRIRDFGKTQFAPSSVAFDSAGERLLIGAQADSKYYAKRGAAIWHRQTDELSASTPHAVPGPVAFRPDGTALQLVPQPGLLPALGASTIGLLGAGLGEGPFVAVSALVPGRTQPDPCLLLWDVAKQQVMKTLAFRTGPNLPAVSEFVRNEQEFALTALSRDGAFVAAAASGPEATKVVAVWEAESGKQLFQQGLEASGLAFSPDQTLLAVGERDGQIRVYSIPEGRLRSTLTGTQLPVHCLAFSFDNKLLAAGSGGGTLTVWDWEKCLPISHCHGSSFDIFAVAFSPDGVTVASGGRYEAKLWDVATGRLLLNLQQGDFVTGLAFSPYGFRLAVSGQGLFGRANGLIVWGLESGRGIQTLRGLNAVVSRVCFSPDGRFLAALSHNWQVAIWELSTGHLRLLLDVPQGSTADHAALAFSPDGSRFAFSTWGEAKLWDIATGKELKRWLLPEGLHDVLAFHPSGKLLLFRVESVMASPVCRLRDLLGPEPTKAISEDREFNWYVEQLAGSSTGSYFTAMGRRKDPDREGWAIKVLDGLTGKTLWSRPCERGEGLVFDPSGESLAMAYADGTMTLVEPSSGNPLGALEPSHHPLCPGARYRVTAAPPSPRAPTALQVRGPGRLDSMVALAIDGGYQYLTFNFDGSLLAYGNLDGRVSVCNLSEIEDRLQELGLGR